MTSQPTGVMTGLKPDLYRTNAFRITHLPPAATQRDVARRSERLQMAARLGSPAEQARGPIALQPAPDESTIREAFQRLRDPEARIVDEFFWFWPADSSDPAIAELERGDAAAARKIWGDQIGEAAVAVIAHHNLAVLSHLIALDFEHKSLQEGRPPDPLAARLRDQAWTSAWANWRKVIDDSAFWEVFRRRIRAHNEPQIPDLLADDFRRELPLALLGINAQLAVALAGKGLPFEVARHQALLRASKQDASDHDHAIRCALRPVRERIKMLCNTATPNDGQGNWRTAVDLFNGVAALPAGPDDRDNLLEDVAPALLHLCWFCQKNEAEPGSHAAVPMHGLVTRCRTRQGESVHWDRQVVEVPRCWPCAQAHLRWPTLAAAGAVPPGVRSEAEKTTFPFVAKLLSEGWGIGGAPDEI
jgi:hypothetical protein